MSQPHCYVVSIPDAKCARKVMANSSDHTFSYSCIKFETFGLLCSHILKFLNILGIHCIPDQYISSRWTRNAKKGIIHDISGQEVHEDPKLAVTNCYRILCSALIKIASRAAESEKTFGLVFKASRELSTSVEEMLQNYTGSAKEDPRGGCMPNLNDSLNVNDSNPMAKSNLRKAKGFKKRPKRKEI